MIETEPMGGVVVRWRGGLVLLVDPVGAWLVLAGHVLQRVAIGRA
jgi:hypothetical protein